MRGRLSSIPYNLIVLRNRYGILRGMRNSLFYIYRNLTSNCFSVKHKGKVIERFTRPVLVIGSFKVNAAGRDRVRSERKKYVHAFVTVDYTFELSDFIESDWVGWNKREVVYNPYKNDCFVFADTGEPVYNPIIVMEYPKVYVLDPIV